MENKNFWTDRKEKSGFQNLLLEFLRFSKMQLLRLSENYENQQIRKPGQIGIFACQSTSKLHFKSS